jgi:peptidoglycan/xylan/chitin deacetylase (PgdA/CDA1 family)
MSHSFDISPARYRLKKLARRAAVAMGSVIRAVDAADSDCIRVLTYHRFEGSPLDPCSIDLDAFSGQLRWLRTHCQLSTPTSFQHDMLHGAPQSQPRALITVDDGHISVARHALSALSEFEVKAVIFVCPGLVEAQVQQAGSRSREFMNWDELASLHEAGHEIAPHGYTHRSLGRMPLQDAVEEVDRSTALLQSRLGLRSRFWSLPFGTRADYSQALLSQLRRSGYRFCFSSMHGVCKPGVDCLAYPRLKIEGGPEADLFPAIVRGCLDHWRWVDTYLYALQSRNRL